MKRLLIAFNLAFLVFICGLFFITTTDKIYGIIGIVTLVIVTINLTSSFQSILNERWKISLRYLSLLDLLLMLFLAFII